jgi:hypothetical protein
MQLRLIGRNLLDPRADSRLTALQADRMPDLLHVLLASAPHLAGYDEPVVRKHGDLHIGGRRFRPADASPCLGGKEAFRPTLPSTEDMTYYSGPHSCDTVN